MSVSEQKIEYGPVVKFETIGVKVRAVAPGVIQEIIVNDDGVLGKIHGFRRGAFDNKFEEPVKIAKEASDAVVMTVLDAQADEAFYRRGDAGTVSPHGDAM